MSGEYTEIRKKLTLSCSRCRISKLKCDRKEPCTECTKRDLGHSCVKDERLPRRKRTRIDKDSLEETEETYADKLEDYIFDRENSVLLANGNVHHVQSQTAKNFARTDVHNPYWQRMAHDSNRQKECLELIENIAKALPSSQIIKTLTEVFVTRCQAPIGNIVHIPSHMLQIERLCACIDSNGTEEERFRLFKSFGMDMLACFLLSLKLGLAFHPSPKLTGWFPSPEALQVEEIRRSGEHDRGREWVQLAQRCIKGGLVPFSGSIASLQVCIMILLDGQEDRSTLDSILACAISGARRLGLHDLGNAELKPKVGERSVSLMMPFQIRTEIGVRIWWALSVHDWAHAQVTGQFTIHLSQVSTRKPLHINDQDLSTNTNPLDDQGCIMEQPRTQFNALSYTIYAIEIANLLREILQTKTSTETSRNELGKKFVSLIAGLPPYFRLGSTIGTSTKVGPAQAIPVHRWMIHQQLWSLLLRFHRSRLTSSIGTQYSQMLALNIIGTQAELQSSCVVCGSLSTSSNQIIHAAAILLFNLLQQDRLNSRDSDQLVRLMTRDKVREAIGLLKSYIDHSDETKQQSRKVDQITQRGIQLLERLLEFEEVEANKILQEASQNRSNMKRLRESITNIITSLRKQRDADLDWSSSSSSNVTGTNASSIRPSMSASELLMDLNVLPITTEDQLSLNLLSFDADDFNGISTMQAHSSEESFELGDFLELTMASSDSFVDTLTATALKTTIHASGSHSSYDVDQEKSVTPSSISFYQSTEPFHPTE